MLAAGKDRLLNRAWLVNNIDYILEESVYYRIHKENFSNPRIILWVIGTQEGRAKYAVA